MDSLTVRHYVSRMLLWRLFQLLVTFAGGSLIIWACQNTPGPPANPLVVFGFGFGCAYVATITVAWVIDYWHRKSAKGL